MVLTFTGSIKCNFKAKRQSPGRDAQPGVFRSFCIVNCLGPEREKENLVTSNGSWFIF